MKYEDLGIDQYSWVFAILSTSWNITSLYSFCVIAADSDSVTDEMMMRPWECREWWVWDFNVLTWSEDWHIDDLMDVDQCNEDGEDIVPNVTYDELLCFKDPDVDGGGQYSHYQGLFGLYELKTVSVDGDEIRYYHQPRLDDVDDGDWYIMWFDEHDSWVINDYLPTDLSSEWDGGHVFFYESYCAHSATPSNCSGTWPLYQGFEDIHSNASGAVMFAVEEGSTEAANCMAEPDGTVTVTNNVYLCFDDGVNSESDNPLSGQYVISELTYNDRRYWIKDGGSDDALYLFYDAPKRFWVIDDTLGDQSYFTSPDLKAYCLQWDEWQPFDCGTWYFYNTTGNEMPLSGEQEERMTAVQTMSTGTCGDGRGAAMAGSTSAGAVTGYAVIALVLCCLLVMMLCAFPFCVMWIE